jgi:hypothetical protein
MLGLLFVVILITELFGGVHRMFYLRAAEEDQRKAKIDQ